MAPSRYGAPIYGYSKIPPNPDDHAGYEVLHRPQDEMHGFDDILDAAIHSQRPAQPLIRDHKAAERRRYREAFPSLPLPPELMPPDDSSLFPVGEVWHSTSHRDPRVGRLPWSELLDRHSAGDFGTNGHYTPSLLTPEAAWFEPTLGRLVRNTAAIRRGLGLVVSRFEVEGFGPIPAPTPRGFPAAAAEPDVGIVEITTRLTREKTVTLARFTSR
jgi:hypothetical protein